MKRCGRAPGWSGPAGFGSAVGALLLLVLLTTIGPVAAQSSDSSLQFEDLGWGADRDSVRRVLTSRGYRPVPGSPSGLRFRGEVAGRPAKVAPGFEEGGLARVDVSVEVEVRPRAFYGGLVQGLEFNHGPPAERSATADSMASATWVRSAGIVETRLRVTYFEDDRVVMAWSARDTSIR